MSERRGDSFGCYACQYEVQDVEPWQHGDDCPLYVPKPSISALTAENAALRAKLADWDKVLRQTAGEAGRGCTSPIGAVQNTIVELEQVNESLRALVRELVDALQHVEDRGELDFGDPELIARAKAALGDAP